MPDGLRIPLKVNVLIAFLPGIIARRDFILHAVNSAIHLKCTEVQAAVHHQV